MGGGAQCFIFKVDVGILFLAGAYTADAQKNTRIKNIFFVAQLVLISVKITDNSMLQIFYPADLLYPSNWFVLHLVFSVL